MLFTYQAGTSTPTPSYTDSTGLVQNTNPIILNSRGECSFWMPINTFIKAVLQDANGNTIWVRDQISALQLISLYGGTDTGLSNAYVLNFSATFQSYVDGTVIYFKPNSTNTGPATLNVNNLGPIPIVTITGAPLGAGQIQQGIIAQVVYLGGVFQLISIGSFTGSTIGTFGAEIPLASATTTDLGTTPNHNVLVTGTTTITSFGSNASTAAPIYIVRFASSLTLTNSVTLILPGASNIVTQAGDSLLAEYSGSGTWRVLAYFPATGASSNNKIKPSDTVITNSTTLTPDPDLVSNQLGIGRYYWQAFLIFDSVSAGAGFKWTNGGSGVDSRGVAPANAVGFVNAGAYGPKSETPYGNTISYATVSTGTNSNEVLYTGSLLISTVGTFGVSWAQASAVASATTLRAGSYLTVTLATTGTSSGTTTRIYQVPGSGVETIPTGFTTLTIEVWGGGGGGGTRFISGSNGGGGGGGGSGGYSRSTYSVVGLGGDTLNYTVGAAGVAGNTNGGVSSVSSGTLAITTMTANGGVLGGTATGVANPGTGGIGGTSTGGTVANINGNTGGSGNPGDFSGGGGGGGSGAPGVSGVFDGGNPGGVGAGLHAFTSGTNGGVGICLFSYS
jgi:hypothetical protein